MVFHTCAVPGCSSTTKKLRKPEKYPWLQELKVFFVPFPSKKRDARRLNQWLRAIRRKDFEPNRHSRICSLHFENFSGPKDKRDVPTLFNWNSFGQPQNQRQSKTSQQAASDSSVSVSLHCPSGSSTAANSTLTSGCESIPTVSVTQENTVVFPDESCDVANFEEVSKNVISTPSLLECVQPPDLHDYCTDYHREREKAVKEPVEVRDGSTQTEIGAEYFNNRGNVTEMFVEDVLKDNKSVKKYTGFDSLVLLHGLFNILLPFAGKLKYWSGQESASAKRYEQGTKKKPGPKRKLSLFNEYLMTLMRMRLDLPTFMLADIFNISDTRVSQIFITWVSFMDEVLSPLLTWPSMQKVQRHMPSSFKKKFPRSRCIIDCSEFYIKRPRQPTPQAKTYSSYKSHNTFKVLFGVTPTGAFSFVSKLWGGNTSDRFIVENSGFLDGVEAGDDIMADRGFNIRDLLLEKKATLTIPSFTRTCKYGSGKRLNASEVRSSREISRLRIHVERAIGRVKTWRIVSHIMPLTLKPLANKLVRLISFFCNFKSPLLRN